MCHSSVMANMLSTPPPFPEECYHVQISGIDALEGGNYFKQEGTECGGQPIYEQVQDSKNHNNSHFLYFLNETHVWVIGTKRCSYEVSA